MTTNVVNFNNIIPQCEFLDSVTQQPSRPWLFWLQNPNVTTLNLNNPLKVSSGGTGQRSYVDGELLIGNSEGNTLDKATLTAGIGILIENGHGSIKISQKYNQEAQTATENQTEFLLNEMTYTPGANMLSVFVDGVNQILDEAFIETNSTTVTFTEGLHVGAKVRFATA